MNDYLDIEHHILEYDVDEIEENIQNERNIQLLRRPYVIQHRLDAMASFSDEMFRRRFRLSKCTVQYLYSLIGNQLEPLVTREGFTITGLEKILMTLRYYATASFHSVTADFIGVSESSVCNIIPRVSSLIASLRQRFVRMPNTNVEVETKKREFFAISGMPSVIGAVDGTLIKIQEVGGAQNKTDFFCRKQFYAINTQVVCDANANILDIVARWPGSTHDQTVFENSHIFQRFLNGEFVREGKISLLLGDGGYAAEPFLATPLRATNNPRTRSENMYQNAHIATRNVIERLYGQWKKRFPVLWIGMRFRKLETVMSVIVATAVLHNLCKMHGDTASPALTQEDVALFNEAMAVEREIEEAQQQQQNRRLLTTIQNDFLRNYFETIAI